MALTKLESDKEMLERIDPQITETFVYIKETDQTHFVLAVVGRFLIADGSEEDAIDVAILMFEDCFNIEYAYEVTIRIGEHLENILGKDAANKIGLRIYPNASQKLIHQFKDNIIKKDEK